MRFGRLNRPFKPALVITLMVAPMFSAAQELEQEPNDPCLSAQSMGEVTLPTYVDGSLYVLDVDFFRFSAEPATYLATKLEGLAGDLPALSNPYLGLFDSDCNLLLADGDADGVNAALRFRVPADGLFILAATSCCDSGFTGAYATGSYRLSLDRTSPPNQISGRVVDADTGEPLPGDVDPYAQVMLLACESAACEFPSQINYQFTDSEGGFSFDSDLYGGDLVAGIYQLEATAVQYIARRSDPILLEEGEQLAVGDLALQSQSLAESLGGRLVDALTGLPLTGLGCPYAAAELLYCVDGEVCSDVSRAGYTWTDAQGLFRFDNTNTVLLTGWYRVTASAWDYESVTTDAFELTEDAQEDLGDIPLWRPPVTLVGVEPCNELPPAGGACRYSVQIVSNLPDEQSFSAWSIVTADGIGSILDWTRFQTGQSKSFDLNTGESVTLRFSFEVPETVDDGAAICPSLWVGLGERDPYFETLQHENPLFCVYKGSTGSYTLLSTQAAKALADEPRGRPNRR